MVTNRAEPEPLEHHRQDPDLGTHVAAVIRLTDSGGARFLVLSDGRSAALVALVVAASAVGELAAVATRAGG